MSMLAVYFRTMMAVSHPPGLRCRYGAEKYSSFSRYSSYTSSSVYGRSMIPPGVPDVIRFGIAPQFFGIRVSGPSCFFKGHSGNIPGFASSPSVNVSQNGVPLILEVTMQAAVNIEKRSIACCVEFKRLIFNTPRNLVGTFRDGPLPDIVPVFLRILPGRFKPVLGSGSMAAGTGQGAPVLILAFRDAVPLESLPVRGRKRLPRLAFHGH